MPVYEYQCKQCGHVTSFLEKVGGKQKHTCEKCKSQELEKVISTFSTSSESSATGDSSCPTGTCPLS